MGTTFSCRHCRGEWAAHALDDGTEQHLIATWVTHERHASGACINPPPEPQGGTMYDLADYQQGPGSWPRVALLIAVIGVTIALLGWLL